jgi:hypothetical protein
MQHTPHAIQLQVAESLENCRCLVKHLLGGGAATETAFRLLQQLISVLVGQRLVPDSVERNAAAACGYIRQGLPGPARFHLRQLDTQLKWELRSRLSVRP